LDLFPTVARVSGGPAPADLTLDGADLSPLLFEGKPLPPRDHFYYHNGQLRAVRRGPWKLHLTGKPDQWQTELYQVETDVAERFNVAADQPALVGELKAAMEAHTAGMTLAPTQR
jgi:arylsulfatase A-like enzyme